MRSGRTNKDGMVHMRANMRTNEKLKCKNVRFSVTGRTAILHYLPNTKINASNICNSLDNGMCTQNTHTRTYCYHPNRFVSMKTELAMNYMIFMLTDKQINSLKSFDFIFFTFLLFESAMEHFQERKTVYSMHHHCFNTYSFTLIFIK